MAEEMKKKASWKLEGTILTVTYVDGTTAIFNLLDIDKQIENLSETALETLSYGVKQKLSDSCARPKGETLTPALMKKVMEEMFQEIVSGEAWTRKSGERDVTKKVKWFSLQQAQEMAEQFGISLKSLEAALSRQGAKIKYPALLDEEKENI